MRSLWLNFGEMAWPAPGERMDEIEHALRYGTPSRKDVLAAASIIAAYRELVNAPRKKRDHVVRKLRSAL